MSDATKPTAADSSVDTTSQTPAEKAASLSNEELAIEVIRRLFAAGRLLKTGQGGAFLADFKRGFLAVRQRSQAAQPKNREYH
jgi:hypothetical protein